MKKSFLGEYKRTIIDKTERKKIEKHDQIERLICAINQLVCGEYEPIADSFESIAESLDKLTRK